MTYFEVLAVFIVPPLLALIGVELFGLRRKLNRRAAMFASAAVGLHVILAVTYTTPWDNYLVATGVWWYDPALVTGIRLGWVPIEEYVFFVLQTMLTGLWTVILIRHFPYSARLSRFDPALRIRAALILGAVWAVLTLMIAANQASLTYFLLILSWALIPLIVQTAFGADILLSRWRTVLAAILLPTLYLWWVDSLAITAGTWTINPEKTTGLMIGALPVEEMVFFLMTNVIIVCGMTLILAPEAQSRLEELRGKWGAALNRRSQKIST